MRKFPSTTFKDTLKQNLVVGTNIKIHPSATGIIALGDNITVGPTAHNILVVGNNVDVPAGLTSVTIFGENYSPTASNTVVFDGPSVIGAGEPGPTGPAADLETVLISGNTVDNRKLDLGDSSNKYIFLGPTSSSITISGLNSDDYIIGAVSSTVNEGSRSGIIGSNNVHIDSSFDSIIINSNNCGLTGRNSSILSSYISNINSVGSFNSIINSFNSNIIDGLGTTENSSIITSIGCNMQDSKVLTLLGCNAVNVNNTDSCTFINIGPSTSSNTKIRSIVIPHLISKTLAADALTIFGSSLTLDSQEGSGMVGRFVVTSTSNIAANAPIFSISCNVPYPEIPVVMCSQSNSSDIDARLYIDTIISSTSLFTMRTSQAIPSGTQMIVDYIIMGYYN